MKYDFDNDDCSFCGNRLIESDLVRSDGLPLLICNNCGAGRVESPPPNLADLYRGSYFEVGHETAVGYESYGPTTTASTMWAKSLLAALNLKDSARVLDVGCADGSLLGLFPDGMIREGIEPNLEASKLAASNGVEIVAHDVDDLTSVNRYDAVIALALLEHLPNPQATFARMCNALKENGLAVVEVPCWMGTADDIWMSTSLEHLWYPTQRSMDQLLLRQGLQWWETRDVYISGWGHTCIAFGGVGTPPSTLNETMDVIDNGALNESNTASQALDLTFSGFYRGVLDERHIHYVAEVLTPEELRMAASLLAMRVTKTSDLQGARDFWRSQSEAWERETHYYKELAN